MELGHLDDQAIQDYLNGISTPEIETHLESCEQCRSRVEEYRLVFQGLDDDSEFQLPYNFADKVMAEVYPEPAKARPWRFWEPVFYIIGAAAMVWGVLYYFDAIPKSMPEFSYGLGYIKAIISFNLIDYISSLFKSADLNPLIVAMAVLVVAFYGVVDYLYRHRKTKPTPLCM